MFIAEYVKDGNIIRVYSEHGKRVVTSEPYTPRRREKQNGYQRIHRGNCNGGSMVNSSNCKTAD